MDPPNPPNPQATSQPPSLNASSAILTTSQETSPSLPIVKVLKTAYNAASSGTLFTLSPSELSLLLKFIGNLEVMMMMGGPRVTTTATATAPPPPPPPSATATATTTVTTQEESSTLQLPDSITSNSIPSLSDNTMTNGKSPVVESSTSTQEPQVPTSSHHPLQSLEPSSTDPIIKAPPPSSLSAMTSLTSPLQTSSSTTNQPPTSISIPSSVTVPVHPPTPNVQTPFQQPQETSEQGSNPGNPGHGLSIDISSTFNRGKDAGRLWTNEMPPTGGTSLPTPMAQVPSSAHSTNSESSAVYNPFFNLNLVPYMTLAANAQQALQLGGLMSQQITPTATTTTTTSAATTTTTAPTPTAKRGGPPSLPNMTPTSQSHPSVNGGGVSKKPRAKRRSRTGEAFVCAQCGATSSPMWRRAPNGARVCNSCGVRLARQRKTQANISHQPSTALFSGGAMNGSSAKSPTPSRMTPDGTASALGAMAAAAAAMSDDV